MKKILKWGLRLFLVIIIGLGLFIGYILMFLPSVGEPEDIKIELTKDRIKRGEYLANSVALCMDCHSKRDWTKMSGPMVPSTAGQGGEVFDQNMGFPGRFTSKNITPYHLKDWTDGEILRAVTTGVSKEGKALFPVMPYHNYGRVDKEDILDIIAYIRTLEPIENDPEESKADFPMNIILNTIPEKAQFVEKPDSKNIVEYGKYLFTLASCNDCHTPQEKGAPIEGKYLAGGFEFKFPTGEIVRSANITQHKTAGIGGWTEKQFVQRFRDAGKNEPVSIQQGQFNTVMPWTMYGKMDKKDLKAIYAFLKTIEPNPNEVVKWTPAN